MPTTTSGGASAVVRLAKVLARTAAVIALTVSFAVSQNSISNPFRSSNSSGILQTYDTNSKKEIDLTGPFFQSLGTNGRSCSTCHQPTDAWTVSAEHIKQRFNASGGLDPIFRTNDGSNCDHSIDVSTLAGRSQAYSLLMSKGLIRVALAVPDNREFDVIDVQNPYGCNETSPLSMYRRPLPAANLRFLSTVMFDGRESSPQTSTKKITNLNDLLFDLAHQSMDATTGHAQGISPTPEQQKAIVDFETGLYTTQAVDYQAGSLASDKATGGPVPLSTQPFYIGINDPLGFNPTGAKFTSTIFTLFDQWLENHDHDASAKASIARGQAIFNTKPIHITGVAGLNDDFFGGAAFDGNCGTCHDSPNVGNHSVSAPLNIGVADVNNPLGVGYLPVITLRNKATGVMAQTTDPGRALITGLWADIGKVKGPTLRGLSSRAPYFHNGSADTLMDVVNFYDQRFGVGFTAQEKADLAAFLAAL